MSDVVIPWSPRLQAYNPSTDTERPLRRGLAWDLLDATGLLANPDVSVVDPTRATDEEIGRIHTADYMDAVRRYSADPIYATEVKALSFGFVPGMDTVATLGMHEAAADVWRSNGRCPGGGRHSWDARILPRTRRTPSRPCRPRIGFLRLQRLRPCGSRAA